MNTNEPNIIETIASQLYRTYCVQVGGVAFNGDPLPTWDEFAADPNKTKQADAWRAVAQDAYGSLVSPAPTAPTMRAKMRVNSVLTQKPGVNMDGYQEVEMFPVGSGKAYGPDGLDEDNTYAKFSPSGQLKLRVCNPALIDRIERGEHYYLDFTKAP